MKPDTTHPLYASQQTKRDTFRAVRSTDDIRAAGERCLPKYPGEDPQEYKVRLEQSTIDGLVWSGIDSLTGKVFEEEPNVSGVASQIVPMLDNFDNKGTGFAEFARQSFERSFDGYSLIVSDMPPETEATEVLRATYGAEADIILNRRPYARLYDAASVINWHYETNPNTQLEELVLLVLHEVTEELVDKFERKSVEKFRVFMKSEGVVSWQLWRKEANDQTRKVEFVLEDGGTYDKLTEIPASFVGRVTDDPKLLTEARLEIRAYQKESSFDVIEYLSVPVFYTIGYPEDAPPLVLSASTHLKLPSPMNGSTAEVGFAQIDSAGHESLKATIAGIKATIKGRLSQLADPVNQAAEKTATEVAAEETDKNARLVVWAKELEDALNATLRHFAMFLRIEDGGEVVLRPSWVVRAERAEAMRQEMMQAQGNEPADDDEENDDER